jgi:Ulp1 family protease
VYGTTTMSEAQQRRLLGNSTISTRHDCEVKQGAAPLWYSRLQQQARNGMKLPMRSSEQVKADAEVYESGRSDISKACSSQPALALASGGWGVLTPLALSRVYDKHQLDDESVNMASMLMQHRADKDGRNVRFLDSFFINKLFKDCSMYSFARASCHLLRRSGAKISTNPLVIMPVHVSNNHWAAAAVDVGQRSLTYWDSMVASRAGANFADFGNLVLDHLAHWVSDQVVRDLGYPAAASDPRAKVAGWTKLVVPGPSAANPAALHCPQQDNTFDCGVFMLACIDHLAAGRSGSPPHQQGDMLRLRHRLASQLLAQQWTGFY